MRAVFRIRGKLGINKVEYDLMERYPAVLSVQTDPAAFYQAGDILIAAFDRAEPFKYIFAYADISEKRKLPMTSR